MVGVSTVLLVLILLAALCWGVAKLVQPSVGRVLNIGAVLLITAALAFLLLGPVA